MDPIVIIIIIVSIVLAFAIGANTESFASIVGVKRLSVTTAVIIAAIVATIGGYFLSSKVGDTLRTGIAEEFDFNQLNLISIYVAMAISLLFASIFGLPISSTEAMVGSIVSLALVQGYKINWGWGGMGRIFTTWIISPILGFTISFLLMKLVNYFLSKSIKGFRQLEKSQTVFGLLLFGMVILTGLSRAGNDVNNAIAPLLPLFLEKGTDVSKTLPLLGDFYKTLPRLFGGLGIGLGLIVIGWRVLKTLGNEVVELTPESAFVTEGSAALIVFIAVRLGIPVSGTMVLVTSFIGAGVGMKNPINLKTIKLITLFFFLTPILSGLISIACYYAFRGIPLFV